MLRTTTMTACAVVAMPALGAIETGFVDLDFSSNPSFFSFFFSGRGDAERNNLSIEESFTNVGGDNGDVLQITHFHDPVDPDNPGFDDQGDSLQSFHLFEGASWNTAVRGEIVDISFSIDISNDSDVSDVYFIMGEASGGSAAGFMNIMPDGQGDFTTYTFDDVTQDIFSSRDFSDGEYQFGFGLISRSFDDQGSQFAADVDNFRVDVEYIPAPASLAALGGFVLVAGRRR